STGGLGAVLPQQRRAQAIVGVVSERALHAPPSLMLQAFLPQPAALAGGAELLEGEVPQHGYAAEFIAAGAGRVRMKLAVGNRSESGVARHLQRALVIASSRTGEVFDGMTDNLFDLEFRLHDFAFQFRLREIGEIGVGHRMASDLETLRIELTYLAAIEVTGRVQKSSRGVEGGVEAELAEHGRGRDQVGLAAIVKRETDARLGRIMKRLANTQPAPAGLLHPRHLAAENFERQNVAHIARLGLAELSASELQFVVHQENDSWRSHDVFSRTLSSSAKRRTCFLLGARDSRSFALLRMTIHIIS